MTKTVEEVADFLGNYNRWRRGDDTIPMPDPKELGEVIDQAITLLLEQEAEINECNDELCMWLNLPIQN